MAECKFNIVKHIATLSGSEEAVQKQVNIVSWNGKPPVLDIRAWSSKGQPYKGVTLTEEEAEKLKTALESWKS